VSRGRSEMVGRARERRQIVAGLLAALERCDPEALREADVIAAAGIAPAAFHAHFDDLDACFDFACEASLDVLLGPMVASWSVPRAPSARLADALAALLGSLAAQPRLATLCLRDSVARQPDHRTYRRVVEAVAELLRDVGPKSAPPGRPMGEVALARGVVGLIVARLAEGPQADLEALRPQLLALLLPALDLDTE